MLHDTMFLLPWHFAGVRLGLIYGFDKPRIFAVFKEVPAY